MMVGVHEAKTTLSQLLQRVEAGEEIVIARSGRPVARLVRALPDRGARRPGSWSGRVRVADDFDAPLPPDQAAAWRGERP